MLISRRCVTGVVVRNWLIRIAGTPAGAASERVAPRVATYPAAGAINVYQDAVVKISFSEPVVGVDRAAFTLSDAHGAEVPAWVDQIGDGTWGLFADSVLLKAGGRYTARLKRGVCGAAGNCIKGDLAWSFRVSPESSGGTGDTSVPIGFALPGR